MPTSSLWSISVCIIFSPWVVGQTWVGYGPPSGRSDHAMAYDMTRSKGVLFGGFGMSQDAHTWEWDSATRRWHTVETVGWSPSARSGHGMVFDSARNRVVMFGGTDRNALLDETWEFDAATSSWSRPSAPNNYPPAARMGHGMVYDSARGRVVLFGGQDSVARRNDLWEFDGQTSTWTPIPTTGTPLPMAPGQAMAYDPSRQLCVVTDGMATWTYTAATQSWGQLPYLTAESWPALTFDSSLNRVTMVGFDGPTMQSRVYRLDPVTQSWMQAAAANGPTNAGESLVYDSAMQSCLTFGGDSRGYGTSGGGGWFHQVAALNSASGTWSQIGPSTLGGVRDYDSVRRRHVLMTADTNGIAVYERGSPVAGWTLANVSGPITGPYALGFDSRRARHVVLTQDSNGNSATWEYDAATTTWALRATSAPNAEPMVEDPVRGVMVLFYGSDTWEYDGSSPNPWRQIAVAAPALPPICHSSRFNFGLVYDLSTQATLLFAGECGWGMGWRMPLAGAWQFDPAAPAWRQLSTTAGPSGACWAVHDLAHGATVVVQGSGTWEYFGAWGLFQQTTTEAPWGPAVYDRARGSTVIERPDLYDSMGSFEERHDSWELQLPRGGMFSYGIGCAGSAGVPTLGGSLQPPSLSLYLDPMSATPGFAALVTGFDTVRTSSGWPLPADLSAFGLAGCRLWVDLLMVQLVTHQGAPVGWTPFAIPSNPALSGLQFANQVLVIDASAPLGIGAVTNAVIGTIQ